METRGSHILRAQVAKFTLPTHKPPTHPHATFSAEHWDANNNFQGEVQKQEHDMNWVVNSGLWVARATPAGRQIQAGQTRRSLPPHHGPTRTHGQGSWWGFNSLPLDFFRFQT